MRAYRKNYLTKASEKFGCMMDYAVNDCGLDGDLYLHMFISSGLARQFETGDFSSIAGMSGIDLAIKAFTSATGKPPSAVPAEPDYHTTEYRAGRALAYYQWYTARTFASILRYLPFSDIVMLYNPSNELSISEFCETADGIIARKCPQTNLERIRNAAGMSREVLSRKASIPLRSIVMFEQRSKDINKAQAITPAKIARVLGCKIEDLLE